jgi:hypothetical protein
LEPVEVRQDARARTRGRVPAPPARQVQARAARRAAPRID